MPWVRRALAISLGYATVVARWLLPGREGNCYAVNGTGDLADARATLDRFYCWEEGVEMAELSRLARTIRMCEVEMLAFHAAGGCSMARLRR